MSLVGLLTTTSLVLALAGPSATSPRPMMQAGTRPSARIPIDHDHFLLVLLLDRRALPTEADGLVGVDESSLLSSLTAPEYDLDAEDFDEDQRPDPPPPPLNIFLSKDKRKGAMSVINSMDVLRNRYLVETARKQAGQLENIGAQTGKRSGHPLARANLAQPSRAVEQIPYQL